MTPSIEPRTGRARVYVGPVPERGWGHPGYRGEIELDGAWIHMGLDCEFLAIDEDAGTHEWEPLYEPTSIPAAAVDSIAWENR